MGYLTVSLNLNVSLKVLRVNMHHNQLQLVETSHHTLGGTPAAKLALVPPEQHPLGGPGGPPAAGPEMGVCRGPDLGGGHALHLPMGDRP